MLVDRKMEVEGDAKVATLLVRCDRTLHRSQAWPVRVEEASLFLTELEKSSEVP